MKNAFKIGFLALAVAVSAAACKGKSSGNTGDSTTAVKTPDTGAKKLADSAAKKPADSVAKKAADSAAKK